MHRLVVPHLLRLTSYIVAHPFSCFAAWILLAPIIRLSARCHYQPCILLQVEKATGPADL